MTADDRAKSVRPAMPEELGGAKALLWLWHYARWPFRLFRTAKNAVTPVSTRPTREGLQVGFMASFVLLGAILRDVNLLIILGGTLFATLLVQWRVCAKTLYGLNCYRRLPRSMQARKSFEVEIGIKNPKRWLGSWLVLAQDRMFQLSSDPSHRPISQGIGLLFDSIPPRTSRFQSYRCVVKRHGTFQFSGIELTTRFPLGLMRGILPTKGNDTFIVQPAIGRLLPAWQELFDRRVNSAKLRHNRSMSDEGEFFGLRAYRSGDSPRWIHWRSSARRSALVVKQFEQADSRELVLLLDLYRPSEKGKALLTSESVVQAEDMAIEFVATLAHHMALSNFGIITVAIADSKPTLANRVQSRSQCSGLLDRLAMCQNSSGTEILDSINQLEKAQRRVENLIVVSTRPRFVLPLGDAPSNVSVFWRHMTWLNVSAGDIANYFSPSA